jgi:hypothetical protein
MGGFHRSRKIILGKLPSTVLDKKTRMEHPKIKEDKPQDNKKTSNQAGATFKATANDV